MINTSSRVYSRKKGSDITLSFSIVTLKGLAFGSCQKQTLAFGKSYQDIHKR
jgi:hypothetical protein